jgi:hypothetical protein
MRWANQRIFRVLYAYDQKYKSEVAALFSTRRPEYIHPFIRRDGITRRSLKIWIGYLISFEFRSQSNRKRFPKLHFQIVSNGRDN